jgi:hypothetical protein
MAWLFDASPLACIQVEEASGWHMLAPVKLEHQWRFAAGQDQGQPHPHPILRHAQIGDGIIPLGKR